MSTKATLIDILPRRAPNAAYLSRWIGLDTKTGYSLTGVEHLRQSIIDILNTYPGERIMRPQYGSRIRDLIDQPINAQWLADLYFNVAYAVQRWEPRVRVERVVASMDSPGSVTLNLLLRLWPEKTPHALSVPIEFRREI